jgi:hypothetical protein
MVTMRPTMRRSPCLAVHETDGGELVAAKEQPTRRATTTSGAEARRSLLTDMAAFSRRIAI